jgi:hypothetical protein
MATRSNIAYRTPEGKIRSVYCHWDGYPAHNGEMLVRHYQEARKIAQLVELGSLSSLQPNVFPVGKEHSFDNAQDDVCVFYGRDRGETGVETQEYDDIPTWIDNMEEYAYLWNGREWLVNDHGATDANGFPVFDRVEDVVTDEQRKMIGWE